MTDTNLVRTVRSGIVGLDLALAGGFRLVKRAGTDRESALVLIRGGPGTGKSVLAQDLAIRLAGKLCGDAVYACIEVLPAEVLAQRSGFDDYDPRAVIDLASSAERDPSVDGPCLAVGMRDMVVAGGEPDAGAMLLDLARLAASRGFQPKVLVLDCLSDGYGLGSKARRETVDGLCKLAGEQGWTLLLVEETVDERPSPWAFAVDSVLLLRLAERPSPQQACRELLVTKHRFGGAEPGPHRVQIDRDRIRVIPPLDAYRNAERDLLLPLPATNRRLFPADATRAETYDDAVPDGKSAQVRVEAPDAIVRARLLQSILETSELEQQVTIAFGNGPARQGQQRLRSVTFTQMFSWYADGAAWLEAAIQVLTSVQDGPLYRVVVWNGSILGTMGTDDPGYARALTLLVDLLDATGHVVFVLDYQRGPLLLLTSAHEWHAAASPKGVIISEGEHELFTIPK